MTKTRQGFTSLADLQAGWRKQHDDSTSTTDEKGWSVQTAAPDTPHEPATSDRKAAGRRPAVRLDRKRRKGKSVTLVEHLPGSPEELEELASRLRKTCSTGGTVDAGTIELQGDQRMKVQSALQSWLNLTLPVY